MRMQRSSVSVKIAPAVGKRVGLSVRIARGPGWRPVRSVMGMERSPALLVGEVGRAMVINAPLAMEQGNRPVEIVVGMENRLVLYAVGR